MKKVMKVVYAIAIALLIIGGLNWGLVGLLGFDFVAKLFGAGSLVSLVVYVLIGASALFVIFGKLLKKKKSYNFLFIF
jgi:hypothetical protein